MKRTFSAPLLYLAISILFLLGCGSREIGTGVVLWSTDDFSAAPGEVVPVLEENESTDTYLVRLPDEEPQTIDRFRIELFETREEAEAFAREFDDLAPIYARSRLRALPVRNRPDPDSRAVYRLQEGEVMKVLEIAPDEVTISGLQGHWHRVLTEGGVEGWAFGHSLNVYDVREGVALSERDTEIPDFGREIIESVWRPHDYYDLVEDGTPVLEVLENDYGLFPDPDNNTVEVRTEDIDEEFVYSTIRASGRNHIRFQPTQLEIRRDGSNRVTAFLTANGQEHTLRLRSLRQDLDEVIEAERKRRQEALEAFEADGRVLASSAYGSISVEEDGRFTWEDTDELRNRAIPTHYGNSGELQFVYFPSENLRSRYDGVVSFAFDDTPDDERVSFLYELEPTGFRLTYVPISQIRDYQVQSDTGSSLVMFMSYQEEVAHDS